MLHGGLLIYDFGLNRFFNVINGYVWNNSMCKERRAFSAKMTGECPLRKNPFNKKSVENTEKEGL